MGWSSNGEPDKVTLRISSRAVPDLALDLVVGYAESGFYLSRKGAEKRGFRFDLGCENVPESAIRGDAIFEVFAERDGARRLVYAACLLDGKVVYELEVSGSLVTQAANHCNGLLEASLADVYDSPELGKTVRAGVLRHLHSLPAEYQAGLGEMLRQK